MTNTIKHWLPKVSLREFLGIVAFVAVACAAMLHSTTLWLTALSSLTILVAAGMLILACIERAARQAFAIGFVATLSCYLIGVYLTPAPRELQSSPFSPPRLICRGCLPTSALLASTWWRLRAPYYIDTDTGEPLEPYNGSLDDIIKARSGQLTWNTIKPPAQANKPGGIIGWSLGVFPVLETYLAIGHLLFAFALAYLGGKFAVWVYEHRVENGVVARESHE